MPLDSRCRVAVLSLHTSPASAPGRGASGGLNVYLRELTRALAEEGVVSDVLVRVSGASEARPEPFEGGGALVPVAVGPPGELAPAEERELLTALAAAARPILAGHRYDAVASHHWMSGTVACRLKLDAPFLHTAHTWAAHKNRALAPGATAEPAWRESLEGDIARTADRILVATPAERELLARRYGAGSRCSIVVPGVDATAFAPGDGCRAQPPFFLVVGRLERLKGVDTALSALLELAHPTARLVVVGEDGGARGEQDRLRGLAGELGLADRVEFLGSLERGQLTWLYRAATACLVPSYSETFGLVALEALACGTPLVTTRAAGVASLVEDGRSALLVERDGFGRAMRRLLGDPGLVRRLGAGGRAVAVRHSWRETARDWLQAVRPLLPARASA